MGLLRNMEFFDAVARHGSMVKASEELGVTPSAVSHRLKELMRITGEDLYVRRGRNIMLTDAGHALAARLSNAFELLDNSLAGILGEGQTSVRLAVCSAFGPYWIAPRLPRLRAEHPGIDVELRLYARDPEQTQAVADCMVTARPVKLGYAGIELFEERLIAVVSARLGAAESRTLPLITTDVEPDIEEADWRDYCTAADLDLETLRQSGWLRCTHYILALALAKAGSGVALVPDFLVEDALTSNTLRLWHEAPILSGRTYRFCVKEARATEPSIRKLGIWLRRECRS